MTLQQKRQVSRKDLLWICKQSFCKVPSYSLAPHKNLVYSCTCWPNLIKQKAPHSVGLLHEFDQIVHVKFDIYMNKSLCSLKVDEEGGYIS